MTINGISPTCLNCESWDSKDALSGYCSGAEVQVQGAWTLVTTSGSTCAAFEPSADAVNQHHAEETHWREMYRETAQRAW